jgi:tetratricopeptide (TPR) repeat protein
MKILLIIVLSICSISYAGAQSADADTDLEQKYQQALAYISAFQFDKAQRILNECYIKDEDNIDYILKIAYCNFQSGRYPDAKLFYQSALKLDSLNTVAISSLGSIYERELNYKKAFSQYQKLIQIDTTNAYYYKKNGFTAIRIGEPFYAIAYFLKAHDLNSNDIEAIDQLSSIYLAIDQPEYAEKMIAKGLFIDPNNIKIRYAKAKLAQKQKDYPTVVQNIQRAMVQGDTSNYYQMMLGAAYLQLDSLDEAIFHLEEIVKREKDTQYTHHYLGLAYRDKDEKEKSEQHFKKAIELGVSPKMGIFQADLAAFYAEENQYKKAFDHYQKAYEYTGQASFLFHTARNADLYYKDKNIAMRYYKKYLKTNDKKFRQYTTDRIKQLKEIIHQQKK